MNAKISQTILFLILSSVISFGQEVGFSKFIEVSSPNATEYKRYGDHPVDLVHGSVNISIPLYQFKVGSISVPINLSYHTGGVRVNEIPSWTGVGWNLNSGGVITRSVRGLPDDHLIPHAFNGEYIEPEDYPILINRRGYFWNSHTEGIEDYFKQLKDLSTFKYDILEFQLGEINPDDKTKYDAAKSSNIAYLKLRERDYVSDEYCYNINGVTGKFYFNSIKGESGKDSVEIITHPHREWKIKITEFDDYGRFSGFLVTTESGVKYLFGSKDKSSKNKEYYSSETYTGINSWYLSEIIPVDNPNVIKFNYTSHHSTDNSVCRINDFKNGFYTAKNVPSSVNYNEYNVGVDGYESDITSFKPSNFSSRYTKSGTILHNIYLESIETANQLISFHRAPVSSRLFNNGVSLHWQYSDGFVWNTPKEVTEFCTNNDEKMQKLTGIIIRDKINNQNKREISFSYDDEVNKRWFLTEIIEGEKSYNFSYIPGLPVQKNDQQYYNIQTDHWGFYNAFPSAFVSTIVPYWFGMYGSNRNVNENYTNTGSLKEIRYPTGGRTKFDYEANRFGKVKYDNKNKFNSGLPIVKNLDFDFSINIDEVTYFYGKYKGNRFCFLLKPGTYRRSDFIDYGRNFNNQLGFGSNPNTYYSIDANNIPFDNFLYYFTKDDVITSYGPGIRIKSIEKYDIDNELVGKTDYEYVLDDLSSSGVVLEKPNYVEKILKYEKNVLCLNTLELINRNSQELIYTRVVEKQLDNGSVVYHYNDNVSSEPVKEVIDFLSSGLRSLSPNRFGFLKYDVPDRQVDLSSWGKLYLKEVFDRNNQLKKKVEYQYYTKFASNRTLLISKNPSYFHNFFVSYFVRDWRFKENLLKSETVTDYFNGNELVTKKTINRHSRFYSLVKSEVTDNENCVISKIYKYPFDYDLSKIESQANIFREMIDSNFICLPVEIQTVKNGKLTSAILNEYLLCQNKFRLKKMYSYENKKLLDVDNLNTNNYGKYDKWNHSPNQFKLKYEYFYENGLISSIRSNIEEQSYLWGYNNNHLVAKIINSGPQKLIHVKNSIGMYVNKLSDYQNSKLRSNFPNSQVESYKYDPVFGLIEITDVNNLSTHYEYDNMGRLMTVRDENLNILSKYEYHDVKNQKTIQNYFSFKYEGVDLGSSGFIQGLKLSDEIKIETNLDWEIVEDLDWLSIDKSKGTGSYMIKFTCKNRINTDRVGRITVKTENREYYLYVRQFKSNHFYFKTSGGIHKELFLCYSDYNNHTFEILSDDNLTIQSDQAWLDCTVLRQDEKYIVCLNTNSFQNMRTANVFIKGSTTNSVVKVFQKVPGVEIVLNDGNVIKKMIDSRTMLLERRDSDFRSIKMIGVIVSGNYRVDCVNCILFDTVENVILKNIEGGFIKGGLELSSGKGEVKFYSQEDNTLVFKIIIN
ncbi:hypothetical protein DF185_22690 [Marinifilum breve]|uniref:BACON domain-containing protein n=1 Tax=Marinifilum breve TaxID=2184082 RepID=A0A2V3ZR12_9BACT|nr:BACON domain-containing carbohydrate-binding protein [Marinifilum breve]PXX95022.1 hypothetical protein DF185_22690 [Marinifilum breve]